MSGELSPAEANRLFYREHAARYDKTEFCAFEKAPQSRLRELLSRAVELAGQPARALDAGGGTGNASLVLVDLGVDPLVVDVSPEMVAGWERKARGRGHAPRSEVASLERFFVEDQRSWDLIVFSSVLHHLAEPLSVLSAAAGRLAAGGVIVTVFDPLEATRATQVARRLDYAAWTLIHSPSRVPQLVRRRIGSAAAPAAREQNVGAIAELHAVTGLDDEAIASQMAGHGVEVVHHERSFDARYSLLRAGLRLAGAPTSFSFILRKPR